MFLSAWSRKRLAPAAICMLAALLLASCNLGADQAQTVISGVPNVQLSAPLPNATFMEGVPVNIQALISNAGPDIGRVEIVVVSHQQEPNDLACLTSLGIDPMAKRYLFLKSRVHWRAGFKDIARHIVECDGIGVCTSDYTMLDFRRVPRPMFPLDPMG